MRLRSRTASRWLATLVLGGGANLVACSPRVSPQSASGGSSGLKHPEETHFKDLLQLTDGGENAEAYWSFDSSRLIMQAHSGEGCDQIYMLPVDRPLPETTLVSTGKGTTTCAYFFPGDQEILYSSTHAAAAECPPKPDHSKGYVWPLYDTFEIYKASADGSNLRPLTQSPGYDAEATICPKDGSIIFTSTRDGDLELYRMDKDGQNVQRLTNTPGYDGGAFFNEDCTKIVWRASRPEGPALDDYKQLLSEGLVRPTQLELYVADADGANAHQVTYLKTASFGPFFAPGSKRIVFSSNYGDPKGREFDIWSIGVDGTGLERITHTPGFDGFPMFSPDGKKFAFASNRASRPGTYDTNVFVTEWVEHEPKVVAETAADRVEKDITWLAAPEREGRGVGTPGLEAAGGYVEERFRSLGLAPAGDAGSFRQPLDVVTHVSAANATQLTVDGAPLSGEQFQPLGYSGQGSVTGDLVLAGYGISAPEIGVDDYKGLSVKGKVVVVRRFVPETPAFAETSAKRRYGDLRYKAWVARERGAKAVLVVDSPLPPPGAPTPWEMPAEAAFPSLVRDSYGDAGLPIAVVKRDAFGKVLTKLAAKTRVTGQLNVALELKTSPVFNVLGKLPAQAPAAERLPGTLVIGAHYDHLGYGGPSSLAPDDNSPHLGADDNASGVAVMLEVARALAQAPGRRRDVLFAAFTAEELGILGSSHWVKSPPTGLNVGDVFAMVNFDMVGRLRDNTVAVLGAETASEWADVLPNACAAAGVHCALSGSGYGPSDQSAFYAAGVPVLHFFTGAHSEYHKPSDHPALINAGGAAQIADIAARLASPEKPLERLTFREVPPEDPRGDVRSFNASLGTIPDYAGSPGKKGVLLSGVRPGSGAEQGGLRRGDLLIKLGTQTVDGVHDLMFALNSAKPGQTVTAVVVRDGKEQQFKVTYQESKRGASTAGASPGSAAGQAGAPGAPTHGAPVSGAHGAEPQAAPAAGSPAVPPPSSALPAKGAATGAPPAATQGRAPAPPAGPQAKATP